MTDAAIIEAIGVGRLSILLGNKPSSIRNWKVRGIPWQWRVKVATIAKRRRLSMPEDFLTRKKIV